MRSPAYLAVNLVGSALLALDAWHGREPGFLALEAVWALVSAWGLVQILRRRARGARRRRSALGRSAAV